MDKTIEIKSFKKYSRKKITKYLQADIDDDWFQDPIRYSDFESLGKEQEVITQNILDNVGRYISNGRNLFYVPKSNFTLRYSLETDYYDRWIYFFLCLPLIEKFDELLSPRVYSHRYCGSDKYLFHSGTKQWEKFEGVIRSQSVGKVIVEADIQNFFENISIEQLEEDLNGCLKLAKTSPDEMSECRKSIDTLIQCLNKWSFDTRRALPQNRDCSSFLASIYMKSIDDVMLDNGFDYYRYMDDIRIICSDKFEARRAIMFLTNHLRPKHLSLNGKKTKVIEPDSDLHKAIIYPDFNLRGIDSLLTTKKKANVAAGFNLLREQCLNIISKNDFDTRAFRFCIRRLAKLARCKNYVVPSDFWSPVIDGIIQSVVDSPTSTDSAFNFLASTSVTDQQKKVIENYLKDTKKSLYEWQNYWLWKLLVIWKHESVDLMEHGQRVAFDKNKSTPDRAGAMLYISKYGDKDIKKEILSHFKSDLPSYLQRHILLCIKDLDWKKDGV